MKLKSKKYKKNYKIIFSNKSNKKSKINFKKII